MRSNSVARSRSVGRLITRPRAPFGPCSARKTTAPPKFGSAISGMAIRKWLARLDACSGIMRRLYGGGRRRHNPATASLPFSDPARPMDITPRDAPVALVWLRRDLRLADHAAL